MLLSEQPLWMAYFLCWHPCFAFSYPNDSNRSLLHLVLLHTPDFGAILGGCLDGLGRMGAVVAVSAAAIGRLVRQNCSSSV